MLEQRVSLVYTHVTATNTHSVYLLWHGSNADRVVVADYFHLTFVSLGFFQRCFFILFSFIFYFHVRFDVISFNIIKNKKRADAIYRS